MKRGQVFVRAQDSAGKWHTADVLDLDLPSFRAFVIEMLCRSGMVVSVTGEAVEGAPIIYRTITLCQDDEG